MDYNPQEAESLLDPFVTKVRIMKESAFKYRWRRHNDWQDNYTLYRDKVVLNRLTQRQSVNLPVAKAVVKTLLKDIDDPPILYFQNLDNEEQTEIYFNEKFKDDSKENKLTIKDVVDKRQVLLFGRSFKSLNIQSGKFYTEIVDPQDMLVDRYGDPANLDQHRYLIREHIYKPLSSLRLNPWYDKQEVAKLEAKYAGDHGIIKTEENMRDWVERNARMAAMGLIDAFYPTLGETYLELNEVLVKEYNPRLGEDQIQFAVVADGMSLLFKAPLENLLDQYNMLSDHYWRYHYPYTTWGDETERTDFWSDGVSDAVRTLNKVINAWFSQLVENRTLRNYGMTFFNSSLTDYGFSPQTFTPEPWGFYPMPVGEGQKLGDNLLHIEIPDLEDMVEEMQYIQTMIDKVSAATTFQQGTSTPTAITLGEVKLLLANAQERVKSMAVYYTDSWDEWGTKYAKLIQGGAHLLDAHTIHRKGRLTKKLYSKNVEGKDLQSKLGHKVETQLQSEKRAEDMDSLQWMNAARSLMPGNQPLDTMYKKKLLENAHASADEIAEILRTDKQMQEEMARQPILPETNPPSTSVNYKDLGNNGTTGQVQLAKQAGIQLPTGQPNPNNPALPSQQMQPNATTGGMGAALQLPGPGMMQQPTQ